MKYRRRTYPLADAIQVTDAVDMETLEAIFGHVFTRRPPDGSWVYRERGLSPLTICGDDFLALFEPVAEPDGWVPCEERMPGMQSMVLLHSPHSQRSSVQYGFYGHDGKGRHNEWFVQTSLGWEPVTDTGDPVTHWRPIPAPPTAEGPKP